MAAAGLSGGMSAGLSGSMSAGLRGGMSGLLTIHMQRGITNLNTI